MLCSIIIPTVGRLTLARAVISVLQQSSTVDEFEILVLNDSGSTLEEADWQRSDRVTVINTNRRERSVARNTGAAIARGQYLHFLDDDDWLVPGAYRHLWELSLKSNAKWLYGMTQLVDRQHQPTIQLRHGLQGNCFIQVLSGEWIPLQSSWIERETFMRIGGFNPLLAGPEDIDLLRRVLLEAAVDETPNMISHVIMGGEGSTTDYDRHPQASRWAREWILDEAKAYEKMRSSAVNPFWRGRVLRIFLTSVIWNLQHRRLFTAAGRMLYSFATILNAGKDSFTKEFWRSVSRPYASLTFERGFQNTRRGE